MTTDTIYFDANDSLIQRSNDTDFKLQRNFLFRNNIPYEKEPQKKEPVEEERMKLYYELWNKAYSLSTKDTTSKVDISIANAELYFKQFEGKVIRSISFNSVDMFGGEVRDTTQGAMTTIGKYLNKTHITTHEHVIRKNLRFKENEKIKAWKISENERLLRQLNYIEDARIMVKQKNRLSDSVDLVIITQDRFPYGIKTRISDYDEYSGSPYISNFLGLGDYIEAGVRFNARETPHFGYNLKYQSRNIAGSFVDAGVYRTKNFEKDNYGIVIERPFLTTDMKFGGAFSYENIQQSKSYKHATLDSVLQSPYHSNIYDSWLGRTFVLSPNRKLPNINISARYYNEHYITRPEVKPDSNLVFHDWKFSLASLMIQKINFFQTTKLAEFGVTEDIPIGYSLKTTVGHSWNQFYKRPYLGFDFNTQIVRPKAGLLRLSLASGSFYNNESLEDAFAKFEFNYFSSLKHIGQFEMRHFLFASCKLLINDRYYERLEFSDVNMGIIQRNVEANSTFAIQYKPTFHMPFQLIGFKFSAAPFTTFGFITNEELFAGKDEFYSVHGITIRTKNESLIFSTLGLDLRYYPKYENANDQFTFSVYFRDSKLLENLFSSKPKLNRTY